MEYKYVIMKVEGLARPVIVLFTEQVSHIDVVNMVEACVPAARTMSAGFYSAEPRALAWGKSESIEKAGLPNFASREGDALLISCGPSASSALLNGGRRQGKTLAACNLELVVKLDPLVAKYGRAMVAGALRRIAENLET